jgi:hypothetical protein
MKQQQLGLFTMPRKSYHNTVPVRGKELTERNRRANAQEVFILSIFKENPDKTYTAWEMYLEVQARGRTIIKDSVKRAITNLYTSDELIKTNEERDGQYPGSKNKAYKLNPYKYATQS